MTNSYFVVHARYKTGCVAREMVMLAASVTLLWNDAISGIDAHGRNFTEENLRFVRVQRQDGGLLFEHKWPLEKSNGGKV